MDAIVDSRYGRDRGPLVVLGAFRGFCWVRRTCEVRVVSVRVCAPAISQPPPEIPPEIPPKPKICRLYILYGILAGQPAVVAKILNLKKVKGRSGPHNPKS